MLVARQLLITGADGRRSTFPLDSRVGAWKIGRGEDSDIVLRDTTASRHHATIHRTETGDYSSIDAGSHNGTFLNGEQITAAVLLSENDEITVGAHNLIFRYSSLEMSGGDGIEDLLTQTCLDQHQSPEELLASMYQELRQVAQAYMRRERPDHTLQATALVNEAYVRLFEGQAFRWENRKHLFCTIARSMRRVLVDHARGHGAERHGGAIFKVSLEDQSPAIFQDLSQVLTLDEALERLAKASPRSAQVVELHFFAGLTQEEVAELLGFSLKTVKNDWRFAKAQLKEALA